MDSNISIEEKISIKRKKINDIDKKINELSKKRNKLNTELSIIEAEEKIKKYEKMELSLKESGLDLETVVKKIKSGDIKNLII